MLGTLSAYGPLLMDAYLPAFPVIQEELGISASLTQMSLTMCLIGLALGPLAIGKHLVTGLGARNLLL